ncbi:MAG TPA: sulfatase-like hydrolase/transferase [Opitutaceae bacterium]|nr:sulfatase-like hydrolase/transferase [Opitutaceae bacterium]
MKTEAVTTKLPASMSSRLIKLGGFLLLSCLLPFGGTAWAAKSPNILFIMTDQQIADGLSARMGREHLHTPALDQLMARGTYFTRAYAPNPLCMPARNSIFTGRFPHETGVTDNAPMQTGERLDPKAFPLLGSYFQKAGYRTGYFGKWHLCYDASQSDIHGFEQIDVQQKDTVTADHAVAFLKSPAASRPFLLVASFLNPHNIAEYTRNQPLSNGPVGEPPALEKLPPPPANLGAPVAEPDTMTLIRRGYHANRRLFPVGQFTPSIWRAMRWGYYRMIEKVDTEIGRVLQALREQGLEENTLIVFVSDHGECSGAHGLSQKTVFYEESVRVPLIVSEPRQSEARTSNVFVNVGIDLLPTLLAYAGLEKPVELPGANLRPAVAGETTPGWRDEVIIGNHMSQGGLLAEEGFVPITEGRMVRTDRYKYCVYGHGERRESLVDLHADPGEMVDLASDPGYRDIVQEHRERLRRFGKQHDDALVATLLADDVGPRPFERITQSRRPTTPERVPH